MRLCRKLLLAQFASFVSAEAPSGLDAQELTVSTYAHPSGNLSTLSSSQLSPVLNITSSYRPSGSNASSNQSLSSASFIPSRASSLSYSTSKVLRATAPSEIQGSYNVPISSSAFGSSALGSLNATKPSDAPGESASRKSQKSSIRNSSPSTARGFSDGVSLSSRQESYRQSSSAVNKSSHKDLGTSRSPHNITSSPVHESSKAFSSQHFLGPSSRQASAASSLSAAQPIGSLRSLNDSNSYQTTALLSGYNSSLSAAFSPYSISSRALSSSLTKESPHLSSTPNRSKLNATSIFPALNSTSALSNASVVLESGPLTSASDTTLESYGSAANASGTSLLLSTKIASNALKSYESALISMANASGLANNVLTSSRSIYPGHIATTSAVNATGRPLGNSLATSLAFGLSSGQVGSSSGSLKARNPTIISRANASSTLAALTRQDLSLLRQHSSNLSGVKTVPVITTSLSAIALATQTTALKSSLSSTRSVSAKVASSYELPLANISGTAAHTSVSNSTRTTLLEVSNAHSESRTSTLAAPSLSSRASLGKSSQASFLPKGSRSFLQSNLDVSLTTSAGSVANGTDSSVSKLVNRSTGFASLTIWAPGSKGASSFNATPILSGSGKSLMENKTGTTLQTGTSNYNAVNPSNKTLGAKPTNSRAPKFSQKNTSVVSQFGSLGSLRTNFTTGSVSAIKSREQGTQGTTTTASSSSQEGYRRSVSSKESFSTNKSYLTSQRSLRGPGSVVTNGTRVPNIIPTAIVPLSNYSSSQAEASSSYASSQKVISRQGTASFNLSTTKNLSATLSQNEPTALPSLVSGTPSKNISRSLLPSSAYGTVSATRVQGSNTSGQSNRNASFYVIQSSTSNISILETSNGNASSFEATTVSRGGSGSHNLSSAPPQFTTASYDANATQTSMEMHSNASKVTESSHYSSIQGSYGSMISGITARNSTSAVSLPSYVPSSTLIGSGFSESQNRSLSLPGRSGSNDFSKISENITSATALKSMHFTASALGSFNATTTSSVFVLSGITNPFTYRSFASSSTLMPNATANASVSASVSSTSVGNASSARPSAVTSPGILYTGEASGKRVNVTTSGGHVSVSSHQTFSGSFYGGLNSTDFAQGATNSAGPIPIDNVTATNGVTSWTTFAIGSETTSRYFIVPTISYSGQEVSTYTQTDVVSAGSQSAVLTLTLTLPKSNNIREPTSSPQVSQTVSEKASGNHSKSTLTTTVTVPCTHATCKAPSTTTSYTTVCTFTWDIPSGTECATETALTSTIVVSENSKTISVPVTIPCYETARRSKSSSLLTGIPAPASPGLGSNSQFSAVSTGNPSVSQGSTEVAKAGSSSKSLLSSLPAESSTRGKNESTIVASLQSLSGNFSSSSARGYLSENSHTVPGTSLLSVLRQSVSTRTASYSQHLISGQPSVNSIPGFSTAASNSSGFSEGPSAGTFSGSEVSLPASIAAQSSKSSIGHPNVSSGSAVIGEASSYSGESRPTSASVTVSNPTSELSSISGTISGLNTQTSITTTVTVPCTHSTCHTIPTTTFYTTLCSFTYPVPTGTECARSTALVSTVVVSENSKVISVPVTVPCTAVSTQHLSSVGVALQNTSREARSIPSTQTVSISAGGSLSTSAATPETLNGSSTIPITGIITGPITGSVVRATSFRVTGSANTLGENTGPSETPSYTVITIPCHHTEICSSRGYILSTIYPAPTSSHIGESRAIGSLCATPATLTMISEGSTITTTTSLLCLSSGKSLLPSSTVVASSHGLSPSTAITEIQSTTPVHESYSLVETGAEGSTLAYCVSTSVHITGDLTYTRVSTVPCAPESSSVTPSEVPSAHSLPYQTFSESSATQFTATQSEVKSASRFGSESQTPYTAPSKSSGGSETESSQPSSRITSTPRLALSSAETQTIITTTVAVPCTHITCQNIGTTTLYTSVCTFTVPTPTAGECSKSSEIISTVVISENSKAITMPVTIPCTASIPGQPIGNSKSSFLPSYSVEATSVSHSVITEVLSSGLSVTTSVSASTSSPTSLRTTAESREIGSGLPSSSSSGSETSLQGNHSTVSAFIFSSSSTSTKGSLAISTPSFETQEMQSTSSRTNQGQSPSASTSATSSEYRASATSYATLPSNSLPSEKGTPTTASLASTQSIPMAGSVFSGLSPSTVSWSQAPRVTSSIKSTTGVESHQSASESPSYTVITVPCQHTAICSSRGYELSTIYPAPSASGTISRCAVSTELTILHGTVTTTVATSVLCSSSQAPGFSTYSPVGSTNQRSNSETISVSPSRLSGYESPSSMSLFSNASPFSPTESGAPGKSAASSIFSSTAVIPPISGPGSAPTTTYGPGNSVASTLSFTCRESTCIETIFTTVCSFTVPPTTSAGQCVSGSVLTSVVTAEGQQSTLVIPVSIPCGSSIPGRSVTHASNMGSVVAPHTETTSLSSPAQVFESSSTPLQQTSSGSVIPPISVSTSRALSLGSNTLLQPTQPSLSTHESPSGHSVPPQSSPAGYTESVSSERTPSAANSLSSFSTNSLVSTVPSAPSTYGPGETMASTLTFTCTKSTCVETLFTTICSLTVPATTASGQCVTASEITSTVRAQGQLSTLTIPVSIPCGSMISASSVSASTPTQSGTSLVGSSSLTGLSSEAPSTLSSQISEKASTASFEASGTSTSTTTTGVSEIPVSPSSLAPSTTYGPGKTVATTVTFPCTQESCTEMVETTVCSFTVPPTTTQHQCITASMVTSTVYVGVHSTVLTIPVSIPCGSSIPLSSSSSTLASISHSVHPSGAASETGVSTSTNNSITFALTTPASASASQSQSGTSPTLTVSSESTRAQSGGKSFSTSAGVPPSPSSSPGLPVYSGSVPSSSPIGSASGPVQNRLISGSAESSLSQATTQVPASPPNQGPGQTVRTTLTFSCTAGTCVEKMFTTVCSLTIPSTTTSGQCVTGSVVTSTVVAQGQSSEITVPISIPCGSSIIPGYSVTGSQNQLSSTPHSSAPAAHETSSVPTVSTESTLPTSSSSSGPSSARNESSASSTTSGVVHSTSSESSIGTSREGSPTHSPVSRIPPSGPSPASGSSRSPATSEESSFALSVSSPIETPRGPVPSGSQHSSSQVGVPTAAPGPGQTARSTITFTCTEKTCTETFFTTVCLLTIPSTTTAGQCVTASSVTSTLVARGQSSTITMPISIPCGSSIVPGLSTPQAFQSGSVASSTPSSESVQHLPSASALVSLKNPAPSTPSQVSVTPPIASRVATLESSGVTSLELGSSITQLSTISQPLLSTTIPSVSASATAPGGSNSTHSASSTSITYGPGSTIASTLTFTCTAETCTETVFTTICSLTVPATSESGQCVTASQFTSTVTAQGQQSVITVPVSIPCGASMSATAAPSSTQSALSTASITSQATRSAQQTTVSAPSAASPSQGTAVTTLVTIPCTHSQCHTSIYSTPVVISIPTPTVTSGCMTSTVYTTEVVMPLASTAIVTTISLPCGSSLNTEVSNVPSSTIASFSSTAGQPSVFSPEKGSPSSGSTAPSIGSLTSAATGSVVNTQATASPASEFPASESPRSGSLISETPSAPSTGSLTSAATGSVVNTQATASPASVSPASVSTASVSTASVSPSSGSLISEAPSTVSSSSLAFRSGSPSAEVSSEASPTSPPSSSSATGTALSFSATGTPATSITESSEHFTAGSLTSSLASEALSPSPSVSTVLGSQASSSQVSSSHAFATTSGPAPPHSGTPAPPVVSTAVSGSITSLVSGSPASSLPAPPPASESAQGTTVSTPASSPQEAASVSTNSQETSPVTAIPTINRNSASQLSGIVITISTLSPTTTCPTSELTFMIEHGSSTLLEAPGPSPSTMPQEATVNPAVFSTSIETSAPRPGIPAENSGVSSQASIEGPAGTSGYPGSSELPPNIINSAMRKRASLGASLSGLLLVIALL